MTPRFGMMLLLGGACLTLSACEGRGPGGKLADPKAPVAAQVEAKPEPLADIGDPLYKRTEFVKRADAGAITAEPVVIPNAQLTVMQRQEVSAQADGFIEFIGRELKAGEPVPTNPRDFYEHPRTKKRYRRLAEGDTVERGAVCVLLDDRQAWAEYDAATAGQLAAEKEQESAQQMIVQAQTILNINEKLGTAGSLNDLANAKAGVIRTQSDYASKQAMVAKAKGDLEKTRVRLQMHEVISAIPARVDKVLKRRGEAIKATEPIMQLLNLGELRVEGFVPIENVARLRVGMEAIIEPTLLDAPVVSHIDHRQPITAVTYAMMNNEPLILTASEDRTVNVWQTRKLVATWTHPASVQAVAATGPAAKEQLALTGADDGKGRIWSLSKIGKTHLRELAGGHRGPILSAAFAPDGLTCVTADDRDIYLWDALTGNRLYQFPAGHRGPITDVRFVPQGRLVSAGRDNALIVWELGKKGARVERTFDHRSGEVTKLGVSSDGTQVLFDQDKGHMHALSVADGQTLGVVTNVLEQAKFTTAALFSPDDRMILTASSAEGILQLWRNPQRADERAGEMRRLVAPDYSPLTCAAFVPFKDGHLVVAGTQTGHLHIWPAPTKDESVTKYRGQVIFIDGAVETSGRQLRVWAKLDNSGPNPLRPGTTAAMVISPPLNEAASR